MCSEVDSLISQDSLYTKKMEVKVLRAIIQWAMSKGDDLNRGEEVRMNLKSGWYWAEEDGITVTVTVTVTGYLF